MDMPVSSARVCDLDEPLFCALRDGDAYAMAELVRRHGPWVRSVVFGVLGRRSDLDDVVQEVWLNVWCRAEGLREPRHWRTWLYRLARNAAVDAGRRTTRRRSLWQRLLQRTRRDDAIDDSRADRRLVLDEQHRAALDAIESLPTLYREPFVLRHLEEMSYRQIAQVMGLPINTVEIRLVRARRLLRQALKGLK